MDCRFYSVNTGDPVKVLVEKMGGEPDRLVRGTRSVPYWDYCDGTTLYWFPVVDGKVVHTYRTTGLSKHGVDHYCGDLPLRPAEKVGGDPAGRFLGPLSVPAHEQ